MKIFSIFDVKAKLYATPVFFLNRDMAIRAIQSTLRGDPKESAYIEYPQDFMLYELAEYDSSTGLIKPLDVPALVGALTDYCSK